jgi:GNAT superfamily N-acetyltransferase
MENTNIFVRVASEEDARYAEKISDETERSAIARGTGISKRPAEYIVQKMSEGKAVIAIDNNGEWAGFCYFEVWGNGEFISNSGMIVRPDFRKHGIAHMLKKILFDVCRQKYPAAKIFSITTGLAIMHMNSELGFEPVTYSEICQDEGFWQNCKSCVNYDILCRKNRSNCLCTAMLYDAKQQSVKHIL